MGAFDASVAPVQRIRSGDVVLIECLAHHAGDAPELMMDDGVCAVYDGIPQEERGPGVHIVTGPAYSVVGLAGDLRVTQVVDGVKGAHMAIRKDCHRGEAHRDPSDRSHAEAADRAHMDTSQRRSLTP